jgi:hypothetical protein
MLPFSALPMAPLIEEGSGSLLETLGLKGRLAIHDVTPRDAVAAEAFFRRRWWAGLRDDFRDALHAAKYRVYTVSERQADVTRAWSGMRERLNSKECHDHFRGLVAGRPAPDAAGLRIALGAAAQAWTRAARWDAAFPSRPNPFAVQATLFRYFCWPWGLGDGQFHVGRLDLEAQPPAEPLFEEFRPSSGGESSDCIFLSAPFRLSFSRGIATQVEAKGWRVTHRKVDERIAPEPQLGAAILAAPVVIVAIDPDPDFGLSWWSFQELDFALAAGKSVAALGSRLPLYADLETFPTNQGKIDEGFWPWLEERMLAPR